MLRFLSVVVSVSWCFVFVVVAVSLFVVVSVVSGRVLWFVAVAVSVTVLSIAFPKVCLL